MAKEVESTAAWLVKMPHLAQSASERGRREWGDPCALLTEAGRPDAAAVPSRLEQGDPPLASFAGDGAYDRAQVVSGGGRPFANRPDLHSTPAVCQDSPAW